MCHSRKGEDNINFIFLKLMDPQLEQKIAEQDQKLDKIYASIEKMRKYFLWTMIITIATIVLPLLALVVILPWFLSVIGSAYNIQ